MNPFLFLPGSRVKFGWVRFGNPLGTVINHASPESLVLVEFDTDLGGMAHNAMGVVPSGRGFWCQPSRLYLLEDPAIQNMGPTKPWWEDDEVVGQVNL